MINSIELNNVMIFDELKLNNLAPINLFIGENDTGKSTLLKCLYMPLAGVRMQQNDRSGIVKLLGKWKDKKIDLVYDVEGPSDVAFSGMNVTIDGGDRTDFSSCAVFIPPKEILSMMQAVRLGQQYETGLDETYKDLQFKIENKRKVAGEERIAGLADGSIPRKFYEGKIRKSDVDGRVSFSYEKGGKTYPIGVTAEGIRKLGIFYLLFESGHLTRDTILFVDEPENSLHPRATRELMRFFVALAAEGVQIFMASHNQFVVQQLRNIAKIQNTSIHCYSLLKENGKIRCEFFDLRKEMAENPILDEAIAMFDESVGHEK